MITQGNSLAIAANEQQPKPIERTGQHPNQEKRVPPSEAEGDKDKCCEQNGSYQAQPCLILAKILFHLAVLKRAPSWLSSAV
jgi:hypothetical protein